MTITPSEATKGAWEPVTFTGTCTCEDPECNMYVYTTPTTEGTRDPDMDETSATRTLTCSPAPGTYTVTANCSKHDSKTAQLTVVGITSVMQREPGANTWAAVPETMCVARGTSLEFKASATPSGASFPSGTPGSLTINATISPNTGLAKSSVYLVSNEITQMERTAGAWNGATVPVTFEPGDATGYARVEWRLPGNTVACSDEVSVEAWEVAFSASGAEMVNGQTDQWMATYAKDFDDDLSLSNPNVNPESGALESIYLEFDSQDPNIVKLRGDTCGDAGVFEEADDPSRQVTADPLSAVVAPDGTSLSWQFGPPHEATVTIKRAPPEISLDARYTHANKRPTWGAQSEREWDLNVVTDRDNDVTAVGFNIDTDVVEAPNMMEPNDDPQVEAEDPDEDGYFTVTLTTNQSLYYKPFTLQVATVEGWGGGAVLTVQQGVCVSISIPANLAATGLAYLRDNTFPAGLLPQIVADKFSQIVNPVDGNHTEFRMTIRAVDQSGEADIEPVTVNSTDSPHTLQSAFGQLIE